MTYGDGSYSLGLRNAGGSSDKIGLKKAVKFYCYFSLVLP